MIGNDVTLETSWRIANFFALLLDRPVTYTQFGPGITVNALEGIELSCALGSYYLDNTIFPLSLRPFTKVYAKSLSYELTSGIFDQGTLKYGPKYLVSKYPFIARGEKLVLFLTCESECDFQNQLQAIFESDIESESIQIMKIEGWKRGYGLEGLLEYSAIIRFKKLGFYSENQVSLGSIGTPDFIAFKNSALRDRLLQEFNVARPISSYEALFINQVIDNRGAEDFSNLKEDTSVVAEAKVDDSKAIKQREKYVQTGFFDFDFLLTSKNFSNAHDDASILCTSNFSTLFDPNFEKSDLHSAPNKASFLEWMSNVFVTNLLIGLPDSSLKATLSMNGAEDLLSLIKMSRVETVKIALD